ncbi:hypothetical protein [Aurantiacibacter suaedae]|uniref:hypothetical protein n=1 Tax=Aurantiacibacter suaedae TaxID=2545755 RepID=UPI0010F8A9F8|nr:hypothetical protein [Aurantiacibacter suaedae]
MLANKSYIDDFSAPPPPSTHIDELKSIVASTEDKTVTDPISDLIREIQTLWARVDMLNNRTEQKRQAGIVISVNNWIIQAAKTYALAESLFEYARGESEEGPLEVKVKHLESVIFRYHLEDADLSAMIKVLMEKSELVWRRG